MKIGDRVTCHINDSWKMEGVIESVDMHFIPISPEDRADYTVSSALLYSVRIDSSTVVTGLRRDQLTLVGLEESPAQDYLDLFI
jgi:hypothetical protein